MVLILKHAEKTGEWQEAVELIMIVLLPKLDHLALKLELLLLQPVLANM